MTRAGLGMAALLACVSPFAIGTAHAFEFSAPDDAQTADIVTAIVVAVCAYGGFQGLRRCFRGAGSAFWTSTFGRWLIGRIAGTLVFGCLVEELGLPCAACPGPDAGCSVPAGHAAVERRRSSAAACCGCAASRSSPPGICGR